MLRPLTWLISLALHGALALFFLLPAGGAALEQGSGQDLMVVEQGIAIEGMAKLGEDEASIDPVEAPPVQTSEATPPPEEVKPVEEAELIESKQGPDQETDFETKPEHIEQPHPPQVATLEQETAVEEKRSSGQALSGGDTTAQSAYFGALRSHLERKRSIRIPALLEPLLCALLLMPLARSSLVRSRSAQVTRCLMTRR